MDEKKLNIYKDIYKITIDGLSEIHNTAANYLNIETLPPQFSNNINEVLHNVGSKISSVVTLSQPPPPYVPPRRSTTKTSAVAQNDNVCVYCKKVGHWINECKEIPPEYKDRCFKCWSPEHKISNCKSTTRHPPPWNKTTILNFFKKT